MRNLKQIKIGDIVKIVDSGFQYRTYDEFFIENNIDYKTAVKFAYCERIEVEEEYKVIGIGKHRIEGTEVFVIQNIDTHNDKVFLMDFRGIEKSK